MIDKACSYLPVWSSPVFFHTPSSTWYWRISLVFGSKKPEDSQPAKTQLVKSYVQLYTALTKYKPPHHALYVLTTNNIEVSSNVNTSQTHSW